MACCLYAFDDSPIPGDPKAFRPNKFQISMTESIVSGQPTCLLTCLLPCCMNYYMRSKILEHKIHRYTCCQGYFDIPGCFQAGMCGERSCPELCLCCESFWCLGPSMSSSRLYIMDMYDLRPDPCDNRVVRFTNCLMCCSCMLDFISMFVPPLRDLARTVHIIAECVFYSTIGCMAGQINYEVDYRAGHVGPGSNTYDESTPIIAEGKVKTGPTIGEGSVVRNPVIGEGYVK